MAKLVKEAIHYTLDYPVTLTLSSSSGEREEAITHLTLRPPNMGDVAASDSAAGGDISKALAMIARLSGQSLKVVNALDPEDFAALSKAMEVWRGESQATGETS